MKKIVLTFLVSIATTYFLYAQYSYLLGYGQAKPLNNLYFSEAKSILLGYEKPINNKFSLQFEFIPAIFIQDSNYRYSDDYPVEFGNNHYYNENTPKIILTNLELAANINYTFFKYKRFKSFAQLGISGNYLWHRFEFLALYTIDGVGMGINETFQYKLGLNGQVGISFEVAKVLDVRTAVKYSYLPYSKIGVKQIPLQYVGLVFGITLNKEKKQ